MRITNFDPQLHKVFIDGQEYKPDFLKKIQVPAGEEFVLRIERPGFRPFVKKFKLPPGEMETVTIPQLPQESFGYLYLSQGCQMYGTITFNLYGEERVENVPMASPLGIAFPVQGDGRHPADENGNAQFTVYFKKIGKQVARKINFSFTQDDERVDLCGL